MIGVNTARTEVGHDRLIGGIPYPVRMVDAVTVDFRAEMAGGGIDDG